MECVKTRQDSSTGQWIELNEPSAQVGMGWHRRSRSLQVHMTGACNQGFSPGREINQTWKLGIQNLYLQEASV